MPLGDAHGHNRLRSHRYLDFGNGLLTITTLGLLIIPCRFLLKHFDRLPRNLGLASGGLVPLKLGRQFLRLVFNFFQIGAIVQAHIERPRHLRGHVELL